jgi:hypothetical protein
MVDLALLETVSYIVGALGVFVAAVFYVLNLRISQRNMRLTLETRRIGLMDSLIARTINKETMKGFFELLRYEWSDYEDFERKYGSENNIEAATTRYTVWNTFDSLGMMLRKGIVEAEDIYNVASISLFLWVKFKPIIEENRRRYNGESYLKDFEYLYEETLKVKLSRDPSYRIPETLDRYVPDK